MIGFLIFLFKFFSAYICAWVDVKLYYEQYEQKMSRGLPVSKLVRWLFETTTWFGFTGVGKYRIFQKFIEVSCILLFFLLYCMVFGWSFWFFLIQLFFLLVPFYLMILERMYYNISDTDKDLIRLEETKENVYWLKNWWFIGKFVFKKGFTKEKFDRCFWIAVAILFLSSFIN